MKWIMALSFALALLHPLAFLAWFVVLAVWANGQKESAPQDGRPARRG